MSIHKKKYLVISVFVLSAFSIRVFTHSNVLTLQSFLPSTNAQAADSATPILHDGSMRLLAAALNIDPNPNKGGEDLSVSDGSALLAGGGPSDELSDSSSTPDEEADTSTDSTISVYVVKDGDSISSIASNFGVSVNTILWANNLTVRSTIKPGMSLVILPVSGVRHVVKSGETLNSIAQAYNASATEIATFNGLDTDATVVVGSTLIIPGGEESTASSKSSSATTSTKQTETSSKSTKSSSSTTKASDSKSRSDLATADGNSGYYENPVPGAILTQGIHGNDAVDLGAPSGTPIHAAASGTVIVSKDDGQWNGGYGSYVVISHANGTQTLYAHMVQDISSVGETVSQGEVIGYVGETGEATGNHLHFEVRGARNPFGYSCSEMSKCY